VVSPSRLASVADGLAVVGHRSVDMKVASTTFGTSVARIDPSARVVELEDL